MPTRKKDLIRLYQLLDRLKDKLGGCRKLSGCNGRMNWPDKGVYFFFEPQEERSGTGNGPRVVRVGTHALTSTSKTTLWKRLSQHRGVIKTGAGNHRGSIFRLLVGEAIINRDGLMAPSWGIGRQYQHPAKKLNLDPREIKRQEEKLEHEVSKFIGAMPFLWLAVPNTSGHLSDRGIIERGSIALLSNSRSAKPLDPPSENWLGHHSSHKGVRASGLWNNNHVDETYDPAFLDIIERYVVSEANQ